MGSEMCIRDSCNADPPGVYEKLLNKKKGNLFFNWKRNRMDYSMGLFVYYFGTKKVYNDVEHHTCLLYTSDAADDAATPYV